MKSEVEGVDRPPRDRCPYMGHLDAIGALAPATPKYAPVGRELEDEGIDGTLHSESRRNGAPHRKSPQNHLLRFRRGQSAYLDQVVKKGPLTQ